MEENTRAVQNHMTALQGDRPHVLPVTPQQPSGVVRGYTVRRLSMESLGVLQMLGSPFAAAFMSALDGQQAEPVKPTPLDSIIFAWVHAEDPDKVLDISATCAPGYTDDATKAAMRFIRGWAVEDVARVIRLAQGEAEAVQAAAFDMEAPDTGHDSKKNC